MRSNDMQNASLMARKNTTLAGVAFSSVTVLSPFLHNGNLTLNVVPSPTVLSTAIRPPCSSTILFTISRSAKVLLTFYPATEGRPRPDLMARLPLDWAGTPLGSGFSKEESAKNFCAVT